MPFNSYSFLFAFLPITVLVFWAIAVHGRREFALVWLLLASIVFYTSVSLTSFLIIVPSLLFDFGLARFMLTVGEKKPSWCSTAFVVGVTANLLFLGYFKYKNFFLSTSNESLGTHFVLMPMLLPLGISFLVFQKIAFLGDVRSGAIERVPILEFLLFTLFFPRTIAGPITHYEEVVPQLRNKIQERVTTHLSVGLCLLSIGLFKKCLIADNLASFVDPAFGPFPEPMLADFPPSLTIAWAGVLSYTLQLYFDFSGYSDMALGIARMLGVRLPMNFNSPFKASNIVEFWSRWHITLTRFLTAYIYTPIVLRMTRRRVTKGNAVLSGGTSKISAIATLVAFPTLVTMTLSGLWHGAGWQFVVWGALHGVYITVNQTWRLIRPRVWPDSAGYRRIMEPVGCVLTFGCVVGSLVFFRASSFSAAILILRGLAGLNGILPRAFQILNSAHIHSDWPTIAVELPTEALWWIVTLIPAVMLLPNSLELLRRFEPALDSSEIQKSRKWEFVFSPVSAFLMALIALLSVLSLSQAGGFVYGQF